jgi:hypothetical protein
VSERPPTWRDAAVLFFVLLNLTLIGAEVALAHAENHFRDAAERWPVLASAVFALSAVLVVGPWLRGGVRPLGVAPRIVLRAVFVLALFLGVYGLLAHFLSQSIRGHNLRRYIFSAPLIAPLAYAGLGVLGLAFLDLRPRALRHGFYWTCATLGLAGNAALVLQDHAQSGFYSVPELFAVGAAVVPVPLAALSTLRGEAGRRALARANMAAAALSVLTGAAGVVFHVRALVQQFGFVFARWLDGPPPFAPGLLSDLGLFVLMLVWKEREGAPA